MMGAIKILLSFLTILMLSSFSIQKQETYLLTVDVSEQRNSKGTAQFALYNREDAFPDKHFKKYFKKLTGKIKNGLILPKKVSVFPIFNPKAKLLENKYFPLFRCKMG
jgi:hypothetical protein